jgi:hypothetical protein
MFQSCDNRPLHYDHLEFVFHFEHMETLTRDSAKAPQSRPFNNLIVSYLIEKTFGILCPADGREFDEFQLVRQSTVIFACAAITRGQGARS